jgi:tRNA (cytidine/uridine-2'-O-)-methyltransferase
MSLHVVLLQPEIHWNTGNCGRTCLATGSHLHLVQPLGFSLEAKEVRRAGLDYWPRVLPCLWPDWEALEGHLEELGKPWFFSAEGEVELWDMQPANDTVLIFGGERQGLPREIRQSYRDRLVRIPQQRDTVRSLNLSTAVAIAVYEVLRAGRRG